MTVTVTRAETGEVRSVVTDDTGDWEVRLLTPGAHAVSFEMTGFKKLTQAGVNVTTSEMSTVNVTMQLGELGQTIEVTADAQMVSSKSATVIKTLDKRELESLPTSSRNFTQLLVIEPGVSADISELFPTTTPRSRPA